MIHHPTSFDISVYHLIINTLTNGHISGARICAYSVIEPDYEGLQLENNQLRLGVIASRF